MLNMNYNAQLAVVEHHLTIIQDHLDFTGWAVAQTCCISQCAKYRKTGKFDYPWGQNQSIVKKLGLNNYVVDPTLTTKYGSDGFTWMVCGYA